MRQVRATSAEALAAHLNRIQACGEKTLLTSSAGKGQGWYYVLSEERPPPAEPAWMCDDPAAWPPIRGWDR